MSHRIITVSRCVRRSYLCGQDKLTGKSFEHRRDWVEQKVLSLATMFCIRICAYAVMSNHYHLVAFIDKEAAQALSREEVIERWGAEHTIPSIIQRYLDGQLTCQAEWEYCLSLIETWRERLSSLSWFMKELNYDIALQASKEDDCPGRFWEGRFKSQAPLDEKALLAAMAYVDLNPVRAKLIDTPEQSEHTSIKMRLSRLKQEKSTASPLADFVGYQSQGEPMTFHFGSLIILNWLTGLADNFGWTKLVGFNQINLPFLNACRCLNKNAYNFATTWNNMLEFG